MVTCRNQKMERKKLLAASKAQIGYNYDDGSAVEDRRSTSNLYGNSELRDDSEDENSDLENFLNGIEDIPVSRDYYDARSLAEINTCSHCYGMVRGDMEKYLGEDAEAKEKKEVRDAIMAEKSKMAGKGSRRQRRMLKDELLKHRKIGKLSFAKYEDEEDDSSSSSSSESSDEDKLAAFNFKRRKVESSSDSSSSSSRSLSPPGDRRRSHERSRNKYESSRHLGRSGYSRSRDYDRDRRRRSPRDSRYHRRRDSRSSSPRRSSKSSKTSKLHTPQAKSNKEKNSAVKMTPQERLKLKMQRALKKQLKADKSAEAEKRAQVYHEQMERADKLREISRKIHKKKYSDRRSPERDNYY